MQNFLEGGPLREKIRQCILAANEIDNSHARVSEKKFIKFLIKESEKDIIEYVRLNLTSILEK